MIRIVLILLITFLLVGLFRKLIKPAGKSREISGEKLVKCGYCGVYVEEASAVSSDGEHFCSDDHRFKSG